MIKKNFKNSKAVSDLLNELGGLSKVAEICKIKPSSVFMWKVQGIPFARLMYLQLAYPDLKVWAKYNFSD